jgi:hypothetical protein
LNKIPTSKVIEGKRRVLKNRKFCLECSPFGSNNRFSDDPNREPKQNSFKSRWQKWSQDKKDRHEANVYKKGIERKKELVKIMGGCCAVCRYDKCLRCLSFHHKNPNLKNMELSTTSIRSKKWKEILKEIENCELLCIRCHLEKEDEISMKRNKYLKILLNGE